MNQLELVATLNHPNKKDRLSALRALAEHVREKRIVLPEPGGDVNNHIHTTYSFSPYSPSKAVWMARNAGLSTAGSMDHDSISGADEFREAARILGVSATCGIEVRASFAGTEFEGLRFNNPDQKTIAYIVIHGIPASMTKKTQAFLAPINEARGRRNRKMTSNLNLIFEKYGISLDYDSDVIPLSMAHDGGSVTERHIMYALAKRILIYCENNERLLSFLCGDLKLDIPDNLAKILQNESNPYLDYDLLGLLKACLVPLIYVEADEECPNVSELVSFSNEIGAICAYPYLGDVKNTVTGDKKTQAFEDEFIERLIPGVRRMGFKAVSYMPTRNSPDQIKRIKELCEMHQMFEISGEDINQPRQPFICEAARAPEFTTLSDATWAMIGHEIAACRSLDDSMFSEKTMERFPRLEDRISHFIAIAKDEKNCMGG